MAINIVFDGPPSHEGPRLIEVENDDGQSISVGTWVSRDNGTYALRIDKLPTKPDDVLCPVCKSRKRNPYLGHCEHPDCRMF